MFKIGDIVKIKKDSRFYTNTSINPTGIKGKVGVLKKTGLPIGVMWENGGYNVYDIHDLEYIDLSIFNELGD